MKQKSAVEWLVEKTFSDFGKSVKSQEIKMAMQMEKDQICWAYCDGQHKDKKEIPSKYYYETYGSKGSDEPFKAQMNMFKNFVTSSQTEISDEEIEKAAYKYAEVYQCPTEIKMCKHDVVSAWNKAIKWYREQLKSRQ